MKFMVTSDVHQKRRLWTNNTRVVGDSEDALDKMSSMLPEDEDVYLFDCGDILDSKSPSSKDVKVINKFLNRFKHVYACQGNHDISYPGWASVASANISYPGTEGVVVGPYKVFSIDYTPSRDVLLEKISDIASDTSVLKVVLMHQALKEFLSFDGSFICSCNELFEILGSNVIILCGDVHVRNCVRSKEGRGFVLSPGPVVPQDSAQTVNSVGFHWLGSKHDPYALEFVPVSVRDFFVVKVQEFSAYAFDALDTFETQKNLPPVLIVEEPSDADKYEPSTAVKEKFVIVVKSKLRRPEPAEVTAAAVNIDTAIVEEINATVQDDLKQPMLRLIPALIASNDPGTILENLLVKWGTVRC